MGSYVPILIVANLGGVDGIYSAGLLHARNSGYKNYLKSREVSHP